MQEIIKPGIALFIVTFIAAALLSVVNLATKDVILRNSEAAKRVSMQKVLVSVHDGNFSDITETGEEMGVVSYNAGYGEDGNICGYVFTVVEKGYAGIFEILVGIGINGEVAGVVLGENNETPGLGKNAEKDSFTNQFVGKSEAFSVVKVMSGNNEVEAVAAATITSKAVAKGVNSALEYFSNNLKGADAQ